jgi:dipeptidyl-peptidase-3
MAKDSPVIINKTPEVSRLEVEADFAKLTPREKFYAHYSAR